jgi:hypothetical protein
MLSAPGSGAFDQQSFPRSIEALLLSALSKNAPAAIHGAGPLRRLRMTSATS